MTDQRPALRCEVMSDDGWIVMPGSVFPAVQIAEYLDEYPTVIVTLESDRNNRKERWRVES